MPHQFVHLGLVRHITGQRQHFGTHHLQSAVGLFQRCLAACADHNPAPLAGKRLRQQKPQPA